MGFTTKRPVFPTEVKTGLELLGRDRSKRFRVALLAPMRGAVGLWGASCIASAQVAQQEINDAGGVKGRELELALVDSALEAEVPVEELLDTMIAARTIDAVVGMHISAVHQKVSQVVRQRVPYIYTPLYEGGAGGAGIYAIGETLEEQVAPAIEALHSTYRMKKWALIGNDYVWPQVAHAYAKRKIRGLSGQLVYERFLPFGTGTMARYVEEIERSGADAVMISLVGQASVDFNRAFGRADMHKKMVRLSCCFEENGMLACNVRDLQRFYSCASYFGTLNTEENAAFKERYYGLHGEHAPTLNAIGQSTYEGLHFLTSLLRARHESWRRSEGGTAPLPYRSARRQHPRDAQRPPIFLARADDFRFSDFRRI